MSQRFCGSVTSLVLAILGIAQQTMASPAMPLQPLQRGPLSGAVVVLDPGHGAKDPGCPFKLNLRTKEIEYWEAGYTYAAAYELADMIRNQGGTVYLTCWSDAAYTFKVPNAQVSRPLPRDAVFTDTGEPVLNGDEGGLRHRAAISSRLYEQLGHPERFYFLALHIDAMGSSGWAGAHVCYQRGRDIPNLAYALESRIRDYGCPRTRSGQLQSVVAPRGLGVLHHNSAPEAVLLEMAIPENPTDSWRIRSDSNRSKFLEKVVLRALLDLQDPSNLEHAIARHGQSSRVEDTPPDMDYTGATIDDGAGYWDQSLETAPSFWYQALQWFRGLFLAVIAIGLFVWWLDWPKASHYAWLGLASVELFTLWVFWHWLGWIWLIGTAFFVIGAMIKYIPMCDRQARGYPYWDIGVIIVKSATLWWWWTWCERDRFTRWVFGDPVQPQVRYV